MCKWVVVQVLITRAPHTTGEKWGQADPPVSRAPRTPPASWCSYLGCVVLSFGVVLWCCGVLWWCVVWCGVSPCPPPGQDTGPGCQWVRGCCSSVDWRKLLRPEALIWSGGKVLRAVAPARSLEMSSTSSTSTSSQPAVKRKCEDEEGSEQDGRGKRRRVEFGDVTIYNFKRRQGFICVPSQVRLCTLMFSVSDLSSEVWGVRSELHWTQLCLDKIARYPHFQMTGYRYHH